MQAPTSYAGPRANDGKRKTTYSQSVETNMTGDNSTVGALLAKKGDTVFSIGRNEDIATAIELLNEKHIGALLVLSASGELEGILSERDIVRKMLEIPGRVRMEKVEALMTSNVQTAKPEESLVNVLKRMTEGRFRHMPVLDGAKLVGILTIGDVVHHRLNELELETVQLKQIVVG